MFYKTDFISNDKEEKDKLEQKSWLRGNKTNTKYKLFGIKKKTVFGISKTSLLTQSYSNMHNKWVKNPSTCI